MAPARVLVVLVALAAAAGFGFAAVSTSDFVAHLDRQVHGIHCSFLPGIDAPDVTGSSGCHVTLMSPYSSVLRDRIWGGIPISLPAMAVFAYLAFYALALLVSARAEDRRATGFLALATALPVGASLVMGWIALRELDAACKLCIGIYASSAIACAAALALWARAGRAPARLPGERLGPPPRVAARHRRLEADEGAEPHHDTQGDAEATVPDDPSGPLAVADTIQAEPGELLARPRRLATASEMDARIAAADEPGPAPPEAPLAWSRLALAFALGLVFVLVPVIAYAAGAPDFERFLGACGSLARPEDPGRRALVALGPQTRSVEVIEVLDPLCPACRGFERRFVGLPDAGRVSRRALLFPLDSACNWMVDRPIHAGACAISEAVLCAGEDAEEVLAWAFERQEAIRSAAEQDPAAAARLAGERFPALRACIGSPEVRARLNRGLRWAVANELPVLTPQLYVGGARVCDADTDLGLDWTLARLLERAPAGSAPR